MALHDFSFGDVYRRNAQLIPDRAAFICEGRSVSHRDYLDRIERLAAGLLAQGVKAGDRVAVLSQNSMAMVELIGAAAQCGAILLPVNIRLTPDEIGHVLADGAPAIVVAGPDHVDVVAAHLQRLSTSPRCFATGETRPGFAAFETLFATDDGPDAIEVDPDAGFVIIHTAAVGGKPRGALMSQTNLLVANAALGQAWALTDRDVNAVLLPLFHIAGLGMMLTVQQAGGCNFIAPKFDAAQAARDIAAAKISVTTLFAPMLSTLIDQAPGDELASLRAITGLDTPQTIARFEEKCPQAQFWATFGQTETSGLATFSPFRDRPKSAGRPLFWRSMAVVDEHGARLPTGQTGEIVIRGPTVFKGYWRDDAATAHAFRGGWHHTGDLGFFDADGYLFYAGRAPEKDLIKTGGENVYPAEVEAVIREHPAIADVVVIGVPDPQWSEAIKAVCVLREGAAATPAVITDFVGARIARYKKPKHVAFVAALPKTAAGAIDRSAVKSAHGEA